MSWTNAQDENPQPSTNTLAKEDNLKLSSEEKRPSETDSKTHRSDTKKCKLCRKNKALSCYYSKGNRWDTRCKDCVKKQKATIRKKKRMASNKFNTYMDVTEVEVSEVSAAQNDGYTPKVLENVLGDLILDVFCKHYETKET